MNMRDRARSDLYLAQLRSQSAPNTPGFMMSPGILSPRDGGWVPPQGFNSFNDDKRAAKAAEAGFAVEEEGVQYATIPEKKAAAPALFTLQKPPLAKKKLGHNTSIDSTPSSPEPLTAAELEERRRSHVPAAPGEVQYGQVAIPGAYAASAPGAVAAAPTTPAAVAVHGFNFYAH
jgi:hypothetical protein